MQKEKITALALILAMAPAIPASRLGGTTDDSVCDAGATHSRAALSTGEFVKTSCKNGQLFIATSLVELNGQDSEGVAIGKTICTIADMQVQRVTRMVSVIAKEFDDVRCRITKLSK
jgi:hypothetical protein